MIRVLIVDDHPIVREGVTAVLERERDIDVVGAADTMKTLSTADDQVASFSSSGSRTPFSNGKYVERTVPCPRCDVI